MSPDAVTNPRPHLTPPLIYIVCLRKGQSRSSHLSNAYLNWSWFHFVRGFFDGPLRFRRGQCCGFFSCSEEVKGDFLWVFEPLGHLVKRDTPSISLLSKYSEVQCPLCLSKEKPGIKGVVEVLSGEQTKVVFMFVDDCIVYICMYKLAAFSLTIPISCLSSPYSFHNKSLALFSLQSTVL